jgi:PAS domain S-box-containing protein
MSSSPPIRVDDAHAVLGEITDAGERERREQHVLETLRESERRYRDLFEKMTEGFAIHEIVCDASGAPVDYRFLEVNPAFERLTGLSREKVVGRLLGEVLPGDNSVWISAYGKVALTGEPIQFDSHAEGLGRHYDVFAFCPRPRQFAVLFVDVTARKRSEERLAEADRRKSEFIALLSHELRNPLAPIRSALFLLDHADCDPERAGRARAVIERQVDHLARLVDDLLDVTRIGSGKIELRRTRVDLGALARRVCEDHRPLFERGGVALRCEVAHAPVWVDADTTRLAQVIGNLVQNSAKFTHRGGTTWVAVAGREGHAELRVRDDGIGMEPGLLARLFEPFTQGDRTLARTSGGLGLGLALVKGLVDLHGGTVRAQSAGPGRGAQIVVELPLANPGVAPEAPSAEAAVAGLEIVVIEDNADAGETLVEVLRIEGHRAQLALDGRSGIALVRRVRPDVVLCDLGLPDLDGYEVARTLRAEPALARTMLFALSGYAQPEDRDRAAEAGFDAHLAKPAPVEELRRILELRRLRRG